MDPNLVPPHGRPAHLTLPGATAGAELDTVAQRMRARGFGRVHPPSRRGGGGVRSRDLLTWGKKSTISPHSRERERTMEEWLSWEDVGLLLDDVKAMAQGL